jgi:hypothetical protein
MPQLVTCCIGKSKCAAIASPQASSSPAHLGLACNTCVHCRPLQCMPQLLSSCCAITREVLQLPAHGPFVSCSPAHLWLASANGVLQHVIELLIPVNHASNTCEAFDRAASGVPAQASRCSDGKASGAVLSILKPYAYAYHCHCHWHMTYSPILSLSYVLSDYVLSKYSILILSYPLLLYSRRTGLETLAYRSLLGCCCCQQRTGCTVTVRQMWSLG